MMIRNRRVVPQLYKPRPFLSSKNTHMLWCSHSQNSVSLFKDFPFHNSVLSLSKRECVTILGINTIITSQSTWIFRIFREIMSPDPLTYLPTSGDLKSGDSLFCITPPPPPTPECQPHQHPHRSPPPAPTNCLRTLYDVLHEVHGIKMRFHHCNDKLIFVIE